MAVHDVFAHGVVGLRVRARRVCSGAAGEALAPGVLTVIEPDIQHEETFSGPLELVEIVQGLPTMDWQPNYDAKSRTAFERAKLVTLRRQIWNLEFAFKPIAHVGSGCPPAIQRQDAEKARLVHGLPSAVSG